MKEAYLEDTTLRGDSLARLEQINQVIEEYQAEGYQITLRQLYYQLVSKGIIPNKDTEYAKLSILLVKGRMMGLVDWDAIEDRLREPRLPYWAPHLYRALFDLHLQYRRNRMEGQENYIEVWCEKDALSSVLGTITSKYHVNLMVNRGYSSCTAMHDAYERFTENDDRYGYILYIGDHDPSGLDMLRDIGDRLEEFGLTDVAIVPVALTTEQVKHYAPPPNPAKITDPRAVMYIAEHGRTSWEVDALPPQVLHKLLTLAIESRIDLDLYNQVMAKEEADKKQLNKFMLQAKELGFNQ
jgi:hypothetical protein